MAYDHQAIEERWQAFWEKNNSFVTERRPGAKKSYILDMFPYPSGSGLHVGHVEGYTATDIIARFRRMQGHDVLHPMGWDAYGLPAEQHALATGTHPRETTEANINTFRRQLKRLGFSYDWSREINTTDPDYARWTQWIFLKLFHRGLAFQSEIPVNWCNELGTVLANEEVINGLSERGGHPVIRKPLRQWQLKITQYADRLAAELDGLDWPETRQKQREWIGRSEGAEVKFEVEGSDHKVAVYTTRPDTLFGATYLVVAPDHALIGDITTPEQSQAVRAYAEVSAHKSDLERTAARKKTGVFIGAYALHPLGGQRLPIYTADYVLGSYGTGAIMAVPAHDERDFEFAKVFELPIVEVVSADGSLSENLDEAYSGSGTVVRSGKFDGLSTDDCKAQIIEALEQRGAGKRRVNYRLRDWVFSRQRYWGEPIPIYFPVKTSGDPRKGDDHTIDYSTPIACTEDELPLQLPEMDDYHPGDEQGPLAKALEWRFFKKNGNWFARETNTMPQWAGSCWYYLRYIDPNNTSELCSEQAQDDWMPVDLYVGGPEHAVLHLLYARFWHKVLFDAGVVKHSEPFAKLVHQGMILGRVFRYFEVKDAEGKVLRSVSCDAATEKSEAGQLLLKETGEPLSIARGVSATWNDDKPYHPESGVLMSVVSEKMSKSRGNVVNPDDVIDQFGADSLRVYEMFMGPLQADKPWQTAGIQGVYRFLDRVHTVVTRAHADELDSETAKLMHRTVKKVGEDIDNLRFNTVVSTLMIFTNHLFPIKAPPKEALEKLVLCLAPMAPHLAEELWKGLGHDACLVRTPWPSYDEALCVDDVVTVPVQVNGKIRTRLDLSRTAPEEQVREAALKDSGVLAAMEGKTLVKFIYVPGRVINLVVR